MNKKYIFSDLDGTLLNDNKDIPKSNISSVKEFQNKNGIFSIATGRCLNSIKKSIKEIEFNGPAILFNGCVIYDFTKEKILWQKTLEESIVKKIIDFVLNNKKYKTTGILVYTIDNTYSFKDNDFITKLIEIEGGGFKEKEKFVINSPWIKVLFADKNEKIKEINNELKKYFVLDNIDTSFSLDIYLELLPKGINKGYALKKIKSTEEYNDCIFYAVGDYYNDYDMLRSADVSNCPNNAPLEIQKICDNVLCENNNGVISDLINKIFEGEI
mgnify:CR=1 FL=1